MCSPAVDMGIWVCAQLTIFGLRRGGTYIHGVPDYTYNGVQLLADLNAACSWCPWCSGSGWVYSGLG